MSLLLDLNQFIYRNILIDDSGWGDLILGVVIGALENPGGNYMERRIPTQYFQNPSFENKQYLDYSIKIAEEIVEVMKPDEKTRFKICSGYVLSSIRKYLLEKGYDVEIVEVTGELQYMVERSFANWCKEVGIDFERMNSRRNFNSFIDWVSEKPDLRETLVKTGWKSWNILTNYTKLFY